MQKQVVQVVLQEKVLLRKFESFGTLTFAEGSTYLAKVTLMQGNKQAINFHQSRLERSYNELT